MAKIVTFKSQIKSDKEIAKRVPVYLIKFVILLDEFSP